LEEQNREQRLSSFLVKANKMYDNKYDYSLVGKTFDDLNSKITVICPEHGKFEVYARYHISSGGSSGCKKCPFRLHHNEEFKKGYTEKEFAEKIEKETEYSLVLGTFVNTKEKAKFICEKHGEFEANAGNVSRGRKCDTCLKEEQHSRVIKTKEQFVVESKELYGDAYTYDRLEYVNHNIEVELYCKEHDNYFLIKPKKHLHSYSGCDFCDNPVKHENRSKGARKSQNDLVNSFREKLQDKFDGKITFEDSDYIDSQTKMEFCCKKHGKFIKIPKYLLKQNGDCTECQKEKAIRKRKKKFVQNSIEKFGNIFDFSMMKYTSNLSKVKIRCKKHDCTFERVAIQHLTSKYSCPECIKENIMGENHPNYVDGRSPERDLIRKTAKYKKWRRSILKKYPICDICGKEYSRDGRAHHLYSFSDNHELAYNLENGVGLCNNCHTEFHNKYGYGQNTKEQYISFKNNSL
jgi:5-methylcytosine-specific restriction endonuclease McrA